MLINGFRMLHFTVMNNARFVRIEIIKQMQIIFQLIVCLTKYDLWHVPIFSAVESTINTDVTLISYVCYVFDSV